MGGTIRKKCRDPAAPGARRPHKASHDRHHPRSTCRRFRVRPQRRANLALGPDLRLARRPALVYAAIHGWREAGPYGGRPAYDDIIQGYCGVTGLMETLTGEPRYMPTILADKTCALMAAQA